MSEPPSPLTWYEARSKLHANLRHYANKKTQYKKTQYLERSGFAGHKRSAGIGRYLDLWLGHDLDMVLGLLVSISFFGLAVASLYGHRSVDNSSRLGSGAMISVYRSQVGASILFVFGSLFSMFVSWRRRITSTRDSYVGKRRTVLGFLETMDDWKRKEEAGEGARRVDLGEDKGHIELSGNSLADIYSVFRISASFSKSNDDALLTGQGSWHKVPSLLLVEGDFIALQIGDIAPAKCKLADARFHLPIVQSGERLTATDFRSNAGSHPNLPTGRSSLRPQARELLELCGQTRVFVLLETPLDRLLNERKDRRIKSPQILRKAHDFRIALHFLSISTFISTFVLIFVRQASSDLSLLLPLPLLSSLGTLPVFSPFLIFMFEVLGVAHILASAHPFASRTSSNAVDDEHRLANAQTASLFWRYVLNIIFSRLTRNERTRNIRQFFSRVIIRICLLRTDRGIVMTQSNGEDDLIDIPPASDFLLEKLGVVTALALVDDELACEPHSIPQQLLIPCGNGLKLLDLCPKLDDNVEIESDDDDESVGRSKKHSRLFGPSNDSDSDDSDNEQKYQHTTSAQKTLQALRRRYRKRKAEKRGGTTRSAQSRKYNPLEENAVQFEDPKWWQNLPSLKCIGLACAVMENFERGEVGMRDDEKAEFSLEKRSTFDSSPYLHVLDDAKRSLVEHVCHDYKRSQLLSLANCIGFSFFPNSLGQKGDLTPFTIIKRLHIVATRLLRDRVVLDRHAIGVEESRSWGLLKPDSTSIIIKDDRSQAYQLLSVGDARVIAECCSDSWQGENSTISPLSHSDRSFILDTSKTWALSDLDVAAFSYTPVPNTLEERIGGASKLRDQNSMETEFRSYLVDNRSTTELNLPGSKWLGDWSLVRNQIFLGLLGSAVIPRKEIEPMLEECTLAGVRFVYFSPRNMRRTKELASQMGIDVAWNCAISLRSLVEGEEDPHRMTSTYADWDVNARLPHGVEDVKKHLEEVDNVPLLVSLYTDATKDNTSEMVDVFQSYNDTVLAIGLSHFSYNESIFSTADISIGIDILSEDIPSEKDIEIPAGETVDLSNFSLDKNYSKNSILPHEVQFVSSMVAHSCSLNLKGSTSISHIPEIIASGRAALDSTTNASFFLCTGYVSFSIMVFLCPCSVTRSIPFVPSMGSFLQLQVLLPLLALSLVASKADEKSMDRVPPKNDEEVVFAREEGRRLFLHTLLRALLPAVASQLVHLIAFGDLMISFEMDFIRASCSRSGEINWKTVARCGALSDYSGPAKVWAGSLMIAELALCTICISASFHSRAERIGKKSPFRNQVWSASTFVSTIVVIAYLAVGLGEGVLRALSWYTYFVAFFMPPLCLLFCERIKHYDRKYEHRAEQLRRLQFETRLGMWSPKENA